MFQFFNFKNSSWYKGSTLAVIAIFIFIFLYTSAEFPIMDLSNDEFRDLVLAELNHCDLNKTSLKTLKKLLEERLKCDLTEVAS